MVSVRLDEQLEAELNRLARLTNRPKSFFVKAALREYLQDVQDVLEAQERLSDPNRDTMTLDALKAELGL